MLFARILQSAAFGIIFFYTPELFPTEVRNTVTGAASTIGRVSGMMASFVGGPLVREREIQRGTEKQTDGEI